MLVPPSSAAASTSAFFSQREIEAMFTPTNTPSQSRATSPPALLPRHTASYAASASAATGAYAASASAATGATPSTTQKIAQETTQAEATRIALAGLRASNKDGKTPAFTYDSVPTTKQPTIFGYFPTPTGSAAKPASKTAQPTAKPASKTAQTTAQQTNDNNAIVKKDFAVLNDICGEHLGTKKDLPQNLEGKHFRYHEEQSAVPVIDVMHVMGKKGGRAFDQCNEQYLFDNKIIDSIEDSKKKGDIFRMKVDSQVRPRTNCMSCKFWCF